MPERPPADDGDLTYQRVAARAAATVLAQAPMSAPPPPVEAGTDPIEDEGFDARYATRALLGSGGMGEVRLCRDQRVGRDVAMKVIRGGRDGFGSRSDARSRFVHEARVQGQLEHPSVVPVYDLGVDPRGTAFFTMKRVRGATLHDVLEGLRFGEPSIVARYTLRRLVTAFASVTLALDFAHARGVLHRDLKPCNIMFGDFGEVYVLDWGLAKLASMPDLPGASASETLIGLSIADTPYQTAVGAVLGTPGYMSPEQINAPWALTAQSDVYALGAILFEILSLEPLHSGSDAQRLMISTLHGVDARPSVRAPSRDVPPELEAICVAATALEPAERTPSARALHDALDRYLEGDRDLAARSTMASAHAALAAGSVDAALAGDDAARQRALQQVGRAMALDPTHPLATSTMMRLLMTPPRTLPTDAEADIERVHAEEDLATCRVTAMVYACTVAMLSLFGVVGAVDWRWVLPPMALIAIASLIATVGVIYRFPQRRTMLAIWITSSIGICLTTPFFGPLMLTPSLIAANTLAFSLARDGLRRAIYIAAGCVILLTLVALETAGVLAPSYSFAAGRLVIAAHSAGFPPGATIALLSLTNVVIVVGAALYVGRVRQVLTQAERRLHLHAWHLRHLVPDEAASAAQRPATSRAGVDVRERASEYLEHG